MRELQRPLQLLEAGVKWNDELKTEQRLQTRNDGARFLERMLQLLVERLRLNLVAVVSSLSTIHNPAPAIDLVFQHEGDQREGPSMNRAGVGDS